MIRLILLFVLIYLVIRTIGQILFPGTGRSEGERFKEEKKPKEGEVRLENNVTGRKKHLKPGVGEYVDYEEVD